MNETRAMVRLEPTPSLYSLADNLSWQVLDILRRSFLYVSFSENRFSIEKIGLELETSAQQQNAKTFDKICWTLRTETTPVNWILCQLSFFNLQPGLSVIFDIFGAPIVDKWKSTAVAQNRQSKQIFGCIKLHG